MHRGVSGHNQERGKMNKWIKQQLPIRQFVEKEGGASIMTKGPWHISWHTKKKIDNTSPLDPWKQNSIVKTKAESILKEKILDILDI